MKNVKTLLAVVPALVMALALCACGAVTSGEETWEYTADNKESTAQLVTDFFEKTFADTNQIVTTVSDGKTMSVETIDGTADYITYSTTDAETYSFIQNDEYIYALTGDDVQYYMVGETYYDYGYRTYRNTIDLFDLITDDEGATYSCEVKGSAKDGNSTATLTYTIDVGEEGSLQVTATAKNDLVETVTISRTGGGETVNSTMTFVYGSAAVTVPDVSDWYRQED